MIGLARLVQRSHPKAAFWGLVLSAMGFVGWGAFDGQDFMTYIAGSEKNLDTTMMQTYIDDALGDQAVLIPVFGVFSLLIIGLFVNGVGLHRAGILHFGFALLLPIGVLGVISTLNHPVLQIASALCVCAGVLPVGVRQLRASHATASQAAPV